MIFLTNGYNTYGDLGLLINILIWIGIVAIIISILRTIFSPGRRHFRSTIVTPPVQPTPPPSKTPLEILHERYAKGEINKEEFDQKKIDLTHSA